MWTGRAWDTHPDKDMDLAPGPASWKVTGYHATGTTVGGKPKKDMGSKHALSSQTLWEQPWSLKG